MNDMTAKTVKSTRCLLCGCSEASPYLEKSGYNIYLCPECSFAFLFPMPDEKSVIEQYEEHTYFLAPRYCEIKAYPDYFTNRHKYLMKFLDRVGELQRFLKLLDAKVLDVGCAVGYFVEAAVLAGWDAYGIDVSKLALRYAHPSIRDRLQCVNLYEANFNETKFDVVFFGDTLEHFSDPIRVMEKTRSLLRPGGCLIADVPNFHSLNARFYKEKWVLFDPPQHLLYFSPQSIRKLFEKTGFSLEYLTTERTLFHNERAGSRRRAQNSRTCSSIIGSLTAYPGSTISAPR
jgi:2-polyprenyl-3-methyl-5-hydroxy-6-metoxy-1,4-benzoquinol methylase